MLVPAGVAQAEVTRSSVLTPADPYHRVFQPAVKLADDAVDVSGTTDGGAGDLVDIVCTRDTGIDELKPTIKVGNDGRFATSIGIKAFNSRPCTLRALPNKVRTKELTPFRGPLTAITFFNPEYRRVAVGDGRRTATLDYSVETHSDGVRGAGGGGLYRPVWHTAAALGTEPKDDRNAIEVDGRAAYAAADIPLLEVEGRPAAPDGYDGVTATVGVDQRTGNVTVTETERIVRCNGTDRPRPRPEDCTTLLDTGVTLARTIAYTENHTIADVRDRWLSADSRPHALRLAYTHGAAEAALAEARSLWRFPGNPAFAPYDKGTTVPVNGAGTILVRTPDAAAGSLTYDLAPERFTFAEVDELADVVELTAPATVRRTFTIGDETIADRQGAPKVTIDGPADGAILTEIGVKVFGRASDNLGIAALTVNGKPTTVNADGTYAAHLDLPLGNSRITVTATDGAGQSAGAAVDVTVVETIREPQPQPTTRRCAVPKINRGATLKAVKAKLAAANCKPPRKVTRKRSAKVRKGRVIALTRKAGTTLPVGTRVGIQVSSGKKR